MLMETAPRIFVAGAGRSGLLHAGLWHAAHAPWKNCLRGWRDHHAEYRGGRFIDPRFGFGSDYRPAGDGREWLGRQGAQILLFTTDATSPLAELADHRIVIPAPSLREAEGSLQPMGSLFEQSLLILCDSLILKLMQRSGVDAAQMLQRHANLE